MGLFDFLGPGKRFTRPGEERDNQLEGEASQRMGGQDRVMGPDGRWVGPEYHGQKRSRAEQFGGMHQDMSLGGHRDFARDYFAQQQGQAAGMYGRQGVGIDYSQADQARALGYGTHGQMGQHVSHLQDVVHGRAGPSLAEQQLAAGRDANINSAMALANSAGPGDSVSARMQAANAMGAANQATAQQAGMLRAQEIAQARGELAAALGQQYGMSSDMRGQDIGAAQAQADMEMRQRALNDAAAQAYEDRGLRGLEAQQQGMAGVYDNRASRANAVTAARAQRYAAEQGKPSMLETLAGPGLGMIGSMFQLSDEKAKLAEQAQANEVRALASALEESNRRMESEQRGIPRGVTPATGTVGGLLPDSGPPTRSFDVAEQRRLEQALSRPPLEVEPGDQRPTFRHEEIVDPWGGSPSPAGERDFARRLAQVEPIKYQYTPQAQQQAQALGYQAPSGQQIGVRAQDVEAAGSGAVVTDPATGMKALPRGYGELLAINSQQQTELDDLRRRVDALGGGR